MATRKSGFAPREFGARFSRDEDWEAPYLLQVLEERERRRKEEEERKERERERVRSGEAWEGVTGSANTRPVRSDQGIMGVLNGIEDRMEFERQRVGTSWLASDELQDIQKERTQMYGTPGPANMPERPSWGFNTRAGVDAERERLAALRDPANRETNEQRLLAREAPLEKALEEIEKSYVDNPNVVSRTLGDIGASYKSGFSILGGLGGAAVAGPVGGYLGAAIGSAPMAEMAYNAAFSEAIKEGLPEEEARDFAATMASTEFLFEMAGGKAVSAIGVGGFIKDQLKKRVLRSKNRAIAGTALAAAAGYGEEAITELGQAATTQKWAQLADNPEFQAFLENQVPRLPDGTIDPASLLWQTHRAGLAGAGMGAGVVAPIKTLEHYAELGKLASNVEHKVKQAETRSGDFRRSTAVAPTEQPSLFGDLPTTGESFEAQEAQRQRDLETDAGLRQGRQVTAREQNRADLRNSILNRVDTARENVEILQEQIEEGDRSPATLSALARATREQRAAENTLTRFDEQAPPASTPVTETAPAREATQLGLGLQENPAQAAAIKEAQDLLKKDEAGVAKKAEKDRAKARAEALKPVIETTRNQTPEQRVRALSEATLAWDQANPIENFRAQAAVPTPPKKGRRGRAAETQQTATTNVAQLKAMADDALKPSSEVRIPGQVQAATAAAGLKSPSEVETATTLRNVGDAIVNTIGKGDSELAARLLAQGNVELVATDADIPAGAAALGSAGFYDGNKIYAVANRMNPDNIIGDLLDIAAHEVKHGGDLAASDTLRTTLPEFIGPEANARIIRQIEALAERDPGAAEIVAAARDTGNYEAELVNYFTDAVRNDRAAKPAWRRITDGLVSATRTAAKRALPGDYEVNLNDVAYLSDKLLRETAIQNPDLGMVPGEKTFLQMIAGGQATNASRAAARGRVYTSKWDGKEKHWFSDANSRFLLASNMLKPGTYRLADIFDHPTLFEEYPQLADYKVTIKDMGTSAAGSYNRGNKRISLNSRLFVPDSVVNDSPRGILLHEIQHAVQHIEGFDGGTSPETVLEVTPEYWDTLAAVNVTRNDIANLGLSAIRGNTNNVAISLGIENKAPLTEALAAIRTPEKLREAVNNPDDFERQYTIGLDLLSRLNDNADTRTPESRNLIESALVVERDLKPRLEAMEVKAREVYANKLGEQEADYTARTRDLEPEEGHVNPERFYPAGTWIGKDAPTAAAIRYHGTPHKVDKFSLQKIGSGEGAQAYGWGLYFAGRRQVAEWYKDTLSSGRTTVTWKGDELTAQYGDGPVEMSGQAMYVLANLDNPDTAQQDKYNAIRTAMMELQASGDNVPRVIARLRRIASNTGNSAVRRETSNAADWLEQHHDELTITPPEEGNVYAVEIPDDSELLDSDEKIKDQSLHVRTRAETLFRRLADAIQLNGGRIDRNRLAEMTGSDLYEELVYYASNNRALPGEYAHPDIGSRRVKPEEQASHALWVAGIPGLRYFDGASRSRKDGSHNYVIWDEGAIKEPIPAGALDNPDAYDRTAPLILGPERVAELQKLMNSPNSLERDYASFMLRDIAAVPFRGLASKPFPRSTKIGDNSRMLDKIPRFIKRLLLPAGGYPEVVDQIISYGQSLPASLAAQSTAFGNRFEDAMKNAARKSDKSFDEIKKEVGKRIEKIDELETRAERVSATLALNRDFPGVGTTLNDLRDFKLAQAREIVNLRLRDPKPLEGKELAVYNKIIQNAERYTTRAYLATYQKDIGERYGKNLLAKFNKDPNSQEGKIVADAMEYLIHNELLVPDQAGLEAMSRGDLRRMYEAWYGNSARHTGKQGHANMLEKLANMPPKTKEQVEAKALEVIEDMLGLTENKRARNVFLSPSVRQNRTILEARSDMPEVLRKLMGEITDPVAREMISLQRMTNLRAKTNVLTELFENAENVAWSDHRTDKFDQQLNNVAYGPLDGMWISRDTSDAITGTILNMHNVDESLAAMAKEPDLIMKALLGQHLKASHQIMSLQKTMQVVLSPFNMVMNFTGALAIMAPMQGIINPKTYARGIRDTINVLALEISSRANTPEQLAISAELLEAQVVDSATMGEFKGNAWKTIVQDLEKMIDGGKLTPYKAIKLVSKELFASGEVANAARQLYAFMDVWVKVATYYDRKNFWEAYNKAEGGTMTPEQILRTAGREASGTNISYERAIPLARALERNIPLFMFLTYFSETFRSAGMSYVQAYRDLKLSTQATTPKGKALAASMGMKRLAGTLAMTAGIQAAVLSALDSEDEEEKKKRWLDADWMVDKILVPLGVDEAGNELMIELQRIDPIGPMNEFFIGIANAEDGKHVEAAMQGIVDMFVESKGAIAVGKMIWDLGVHATATATGREGIREWEAARQKNTITERNYPKIYNYLRHHPVLGAGDLSENFIVAAERLMIPTAIMPTLDAERTAIAETREGDLRLPVTGKPLGPVARELGYRAYTRDPDKALFFRTMDYNDQIKRLRTKRDELNAAASDMSADQLIDSLLDIREAEKEAFTKIQRGYQGYLAFEGKKPADALAVIDNKKLGRAVQSGDFQSQLLDGEAIDRWYKTQQERRGVDKAELREKYRIMKRLYAEAK